MKIINFIMHVKKQIKKEQNVKNVKVDLKSEKMDIALMQQNVWKKKTVNV